MVEERSVYRRGQVPERKTVQDTNTTSIGRLALLQGFKPDTKIEVEQSGKKLATELVLRRFYLPYLTV